MTRSEVSSAVHDALRRSDRALTLVGIRALPFAWELRFEDTDGVEQVLALHHGSIASVEQAIAEVLDLPVRCG